MIERLSRQTSVVWSQLAENRVPFPPEKGREKARPKVRRAALVSGNFGVITIFLYSGLLIST